MASAAYLIGSAADIIIASQTSQVGSIGVISAHFDRSGFDEKRGVKRALLYSGKYKVMGNDTEPLTDEARAYIQDKLDTYYTLFVDTIARNRGVSAETVVKDMADGRTFIGSKALDAGLIDVIGTLDGVLKDMQTI